MKIERMVYGNLEQEKKSGWRVQAQSPGLSGRTEKLLRDWCGKLHRAAREAGETIVCFGVIENGSPLLGFGVEAGRDGYGRPGGWRFLCASIPGKKLSISEVLLLAGEVFAADKWPDVAAELEEEVIDDEQLSGILRHQRQLLLKGNHPVFGPLSVRMAATLQALESAGHLQTSFVAPSLLRGEEKAAAFRSILLPVFTGFLLIALAGGALVLMNLRRDLERTQTSLREARSGRKSAELRIGELGAQLEQAGEQLDAVRRNSAAREQEWHQEREQLEARIRQYDSRIEQLEADADAVMSAELQTLRAEKDELQDAIADHERRFKQIREALPPEARGEVPAEPAQEPPAEASP